MAARGRKHPMTKADWEIVFSALYACRQTAGDLIEKLQHRLTVKESRLLWKVCNELDTFRFSMENRAIEDMPGEQVAWRASGHREPLLADVAALCPRK